MIGYTLLLDLQSPHAMDKPVDRVSFSVYESMFTRSHCSVCMQIWIYIFIRNIASQYGVPSLLGYYYYYYFIHHRFIMLGMDTSHNCNNNGSYLVSVICGLHTKPFLSSTGLTHQLYPDASVSIMWLTSPKPKVDPSALQQLGEGMDLDSYVQTKCI